MNFLKGYKTYISAFALFVFAVYGLATQHLTTAQGWPLILQALAIFGLRSAIK